MMSQNLGYSLFCVKEQSPINTKKPLPQGATIMDSQEYLRGDKNQDRLRELNEVLRAMSDRKFVTPRRAKDLKNQQYVSLPCVGAYATPIGLKDRYFSSGCLTDWKLSVRQVRMPKI